jgi:hypothetical protein
MDLSIFCLNHLCFFFQKIIEMRDFFFQFLNHIDGTNLLQNGTELKIFFYESLGLSIV